MTQHKQQMVSETTDVCGACEKALTYLVTFICDGTRLQKCYEGFFLGLFRNNLLGTI